jgi:hypothetical protein
MTTAERVSETPRTDAVEEPFAYIPAASSEELIALGNLARTLERELHALRVERDLLAGVAREARDALDAIANKEGTDRWLLAQASELFNRVSTSLAVCEIDAALAAKEKP